LISDDLSAKITDFGESRHLGSEEDQEKTMTTVGTPYFMAPEVFSSDEDDRMYSKEIDIYSYGMLLLEIFYNGEIKKAFKKGWGPMVVMNRVAKGWRPDLKGVEAEDQDLADIMRKCWDKDPKERPAFKEMIKFFQKKLMKLGMETKNMKDLLMKQSEKEDKPRTVEPVNKNKLAASKPMKRSATAAADGFQVKPSFLDGLLNDGIMPEPVEVKQTKFSFKVEKLKGSSEEDKEKESDNDGNESSGSGMTMLLKEAQKVDPVMAIFGEANKKKEAQKVDPVMAIFEQAKEEEKKKPMEVEPKREAVKEAKPKEAEGVTERDDEGNLSTKNPQKKNVVHPKGSASTLKFVALATLLCLFLAGLSEVEGREHMQDEFGIMRARVDREFHHKTSAPLPGISNINDRGFAIEKLLEKGGEGRVRRAEEVTVDDMNALFNTLSHTGNSKMSSGDSVILAVGSYKCSEGTCSNIYNMLTTHNLNGEVKCVEDIASCLLDLENERSGMMLYGTGSGTLILRALTFDKGYTDGSGGGVIIGYEAIVDLELLVFSNNRASGYGGGALYVQGMGNTANVYGTSFYGNTADLGDGDDIFIGYGSTINIHNTCPSPYSSKIPIQGKMRMRIV
jgi:predicted outer membrane repeat protein